MINLAGCYKYFDIVIDRDHLTLAPVHRHKSSGPGAIKLRLAYI